MHMDETFKVHWYIPGVPVMSPAKQTVAACLTELRRKFDGLEDPVLDWVPMPMAPFDYSVISRGYTAFIPVFARTRLVAYMLRYSYWGDTYA